MAKYNHLKLWIAKKLARKGVFKDRAATDDSIPHLTLSHYQVKPPWTTKAAAKFKKTGHVNFEDLSQDQISYLMDKGIRVDY